MIVLDANVLIGFLDDTDTHHDRAIALLEKWVVEGFGCSVLTVAETLVHPARLDRHDAALAALHRIGLEIIALQPTDAVALARVRSTYNLRMPDAVVLHAAINTGSALASFDESLLNTAKTAGITTAEQ